jgi:hypothetical protein
LPVGSKSIRELSTGSILSFTISGTSPIVSNKGNTYIIEVLSDKALVLKLRLLTWNIITYPGEKQEGAVFQQPHFILQTVAITSVIQE